MTGKVLVKKGEIVTCTNGHKICEAGKDISSGDLNWIKSLTNWMIKEPGADDSFPVCHCGAVFIARTSLNFKDG